MKRLDNENGNYFKPNKKLSFKYLENQNLIITFGKRGIFIQLSTPMPNATKENTTQKIPYSIVFHRGQKRIAFKVSKGEALVKAIRKVPGRQWSKTLTSWHIPYSTNALVKLNKQLGNGYAFFNLKLAKQKEKPLAQHPSPIIEQQNKIIVLYSQSLALRKLSPHTIAIYLPFFKAFLADISPKLPEALSSEEVVNFVNTEHEQLSISETVFRQKISAIKYFYEKVLGRNTIYFKNITAPIIIKKPTTLTFAAIENELMPIKSATDKLLLYFAYCIGANAKQLSQLEKATVKNIYTNLLAQKNRPAATFLKKELHTHYNKHPLNHFIFEQKEGTVYTEKVLRNKILQLTGKYKLVTVYKKQFQNLLDQSELSTNTQKNYLSLFLSFLKYFNFRHPALIGQDSVALFFEKKNFTESTQNNYINALKFYYKNALRRQLDPRKIVRPKSKTTLPKTLSKEEVKTIINSISNIKHKAIIALIYSAGLRRGELIRLKIGDILSDRKLIQITQAKGKKDRLSLLSDYVLTILRGYYKAYHPKDFLFEGAKGNEYSASSMSKILKRAAQKAGIRRNVNLHMLRHSFATHLIDDGLDISYVQQLLGHSCIKTTERYIHVSTRDFSKIINPIDKIMNNFMDNTKKSGP